MKDIKKKTSDILGIMVIGAGAISKNYLDYFSNSDRTKLVAVAEPNPQTREYVKSNYAPTLIVSDYREAINRDDIDIVIVCTPHNLHYPIVIDALENGKHVFCEKPISISVKEADEMIDMAQRCERKLFVSLNMRFTERALKIKQMLDEEVLGRVFMAQSAYLGYEIDRLADPDHWKGDIAKAGGGVLLDGGYHIVDLMNWFFGQAKSVQAAGGQFVIDAPNKGEDNISLLIEYANGIIANLQVSFTVCNTGCHKEPTLILQHNFYGTEGTLFSEYNWDTIKANQYFDLVKPESGRKEVGFDNVDCPVMCTHFLESLTNNTTPIVSATDARNAMAVVEAAYESICTGQKIAVKWRA